MIKSDKILVYRQRGGKNPLWIARHIGFYSRTLKSQSPERVACGSGSTADLAIKDWRKQYRSWSKGVGGKTME